MMNKETLIFLSVILSASLVVRAQETSKEEKPFHLVLGLSAASNMHQESSPKHEAWTELSFSPFYTLSDSTSVTLKSILTQEATQAENTRLSNTSVGLKTAGPQLGFLKSGFSLTAVLPTDEHETKLSRFRGALALGASLSGQWKNVQVAYGISGVHNDHEYTLSAGRTPLVQHSLKHTLGLEIDLFPRWSFSSGGTYKTGRTYQDFERHTYGFEAALQYSFSKELQASVGLSNEGRALKSDGTATNIQLYNENTSVIMTGVTFVN